MWEITSLSTWSRNIIYQDGTASKGFFEEKNVQYIGIRIGHKKYGIQQMEQWILQSQNLKIWHWTFDKPNPNPKLNVGPPSHLGSYF